MLSSFSVCYINYLIRGYLKHYLTNKIKEKQIREEENELFFQEGSEN